MMSVGANIIIAVILETKSRSQLIYQRDHKGKSPMKAPMNSLG